MGWIAQPLQQSQHQRQRESYSSHREWFPFQFYPDSDSDLRTTTKEIEAAWAKQELEEAETAETAPDADTQLRLPWVMVDGASMSSTLLESGGVEGYFSTQIFAL